MAGNNNGHLTNAIGESLSPAAIKLTVPIEALEAGKLDVVYVGGGSYVAAYNKGLSVVPMVVAKAHGRTYYKSCILTQNDSDIKTLSDLKAGNSPSSRRPPLRAVSARATT